MDSFTLKEITSYEKAYFEKTLEFGFFDYTSSQLMTESEIKAFRNSNPRIHIHPAELVKGECYVLIQYFKYRLDEFEEDESLNFVAIPFKYNQKEATSYSFKCAMRDLVLRTAFMEATPYVRTRAISLLSMWRRLEGDLFKTLPLHQIELILNINKRIKFAGGALTSIPEDKESDEFGSYVFKDVEFSDGWVLISHGLGSTNYYDLDILTSELSLIRHCDRYGLNQREFLASLINRRVHELFNPS